MKEEVFEEVDGNENQNLIGKVYSLQNVASGKFLSHIGTVATPVIITHQKVPESDNRSKWKLILVSETLNTSGLYFVKIISDDNKVFHRKLVIK